MRGRIRAVVEEHLPDTPKYWGGAPFISTWIYDTTQSDMERLTPWAVLAVIFILLVTFRDPGDTVGSGFEERSLVGLRICPDTLDGVCRIEVPTWT